MPEMAGHKLESVVEFLRTSINDQHFMPGRRLVEAELTQNLGVSRSLLREAFRQVAAEGLIELVPNKGAMVRRLSKKEALELFRVRIALEMFAAKTAAGEMTDLARRSKFEAKIAEIWDNRPRTSSADYIAENRRFHDAIFCATGNSQLIRLSEQLQLTVIMAQIGGHLTPETLETSMREHRGIAEAIIKRDGDLAAELSRAHLERAEEIVAAVDDGLFRIDEGSGN